MSQVHEGKMWKERSKKPEKKKNKRRDRTVWKDRGEGIGKGLTARETAITTSMETLYVET